MKLTCNTPVFFSFTVLSVAVYLLDAYLIPGLIQSYCSAPSSIAEPNAFLRIIMYPLGHRSWVHLATSCSLLLLTGQVLEQRYTAVQLISVMLIATVIAGATNILINASPLLGSDGLSVAMILFISLSYVRRGELPLSLIAIVILFFVAEFDTLLSSDNLSRLSLLTGAVLAVVYGLTLRPRHR